MAKKTKPGGLTLRIFDSGRPREVRMEERMEAEVSSKVGTIVIVDLAPEELPDDAEELGTILCGDGLKVSLKPGGPVLFSNVLAEPLSAFCNRFFLLVGEKEGESTPVKIFTS